MKRLFNLGFFLLAVGLLFSAAGCAGTAELNKANKLYSAWFKTHKAPGPAADQFWGLTNAKIFGFKCPYNNFMNFGSASLKSSKASENPHQFLGKATCWLVGQDAAGSMVRIQRDLELTISVDTAANSSGVGYQFSNDRPLTGWNQIGRWLLSAYLGPILIFLIVLSFLTSIDPFATRLIWTRWITAVLVLPWVGYISYLGFGTGLAVFLGLVVYVLVYFLVLAQLLKWAVSLITQ